MECKAEPNTALVISVSCPQKTAQYINIQIAGFLHQSYRLLEMTPVLIYFSNNILPRQLQLYRSTCIGLIFHQSY